MNTEHFFFSLSEQTQLSLTCHTPDLSNGFAPILLMHGYGEHIGRYAHVVKFLTLRGFDVWGYDARGNGLSQGERGVLSSDYVLANDCVEVFNHIVTVTQRKPIVIAHSMGGLTAALAVALKNLKPSALVLSSPALRIRMSITQKLLLNLGLMLFADKPIKSTAVSTEYLSHDSQVVRDYIADRLNHSMISPRMARYMRDGGDTVRAHAAQFTMPTLLIYAGDDRVVDPAGSDDLAAILPPTATAKCYPHAYHEIFNEVEPLREQILCHMVDWLVSHASVS